MSLGQQKRALGSGSHKTMGSSGEMALSPGQLMAQEDSWTVGMHSEKDAISLPGGFPGFTG